MNAEELNAAMQYIEDRYLTLADAPQKEIVQMSKKKAISRIFLIAAAAAMLVVTAYAADFLQIRTLIMSSDRTYSSYTELDAAMDRAGFQIDAKESFASGFTFRSADVLDTDAADEAGRTVLSTREISVSYADETGCSLSLKAAPHREELPQSEHAQGQSRELAGVSAVYYQDHYRFVPGDYEPTEEDTVWLEQPGNYLSCGSDKAEETDIAFLCWEKDGIDYFFMDIGAQVSPDTLFAMAEELITAG